MCHAQRRFIRDMLIDSDASPSRFDFQTNLIREAGKYVPLALSKFAFRTEMDKRLQNIQNKHQNCFEKAA